jgi:hypothetical protein
MRRAAKLLIYAYVLQASIGFSIGAAIPWYYWVQPMTTEYCVMMLVAAATVVLTAVGFWAPLQSAFNLIIAALKGAGV